MESDENTSRRQTGRDVRLIDLATILLLRWRIIVAIFAVVLLVALLFVVVRGDSYVTRTVILPTQEQNRLNTQLAALAAELPLGLDLMTPSSSNRDVIDVVLESRSLADSVAADQRLQQRWDLETLAAARERLRDGTTIETDETGKITIEVRGDDPQLTTSIANAYPDQLNRMIASLSDELALRREAFLRHKLAEALGELERAEDQLVEFQRGKGVPEVEEQARQTIEAAAELRQMVMERELALSQLGRIATPENPQYRALASELAGLRSQLARLTGGRRRTDDVFVSLREAPELGVGYVRLLREFEEKEQIFEILTAGLAQARIDATRDLPVVVVVDPAVAPDSPRNRTRGILLASGLLGLVLGAVGAFVVEGANQTRSNPENRSFFEAWGRVKRDLASAARRRKRD